MTVPEKYLWDFKPEKPESIRATDWKTDEGRFHAGEPEKAIRAIRTRKIFPNQ
jgi:hypothetical protein